MVLKPHLHYGRQDTTNFEARASVDHLSREYGKPITVERTGRPVAATSTSESKDCHIHPSNNKMTPARKQSKSLIHHFETHPNREALKADLKRIKRSTQSARSRRT